MSENTSGVEVQQAAPSPDAELRMLDRLVGTWRVTGGAVGQVTYRWLEGGFFLVQDFDLERYGQQVKGLEPIGREKEFGAEQPSSDIKSRIYDSQGNTFTYVYELEGDTLTIWGGEKGSPAHYKGTFSQDGKTVDGEWVYPGRWWLRVDHVQDRLSGRRRGPGRSARTATAADQGASFGDGRRCADLRRGVGGGFGRHEPCDR